MLVRWDTLYTLVQFRTLLVATFIRRNIIIDHVNGYFMIYFWSKGWSASPLYRRSMYRPCCRFSLLDPSTLFFVLRVTHAWLQVKFVLLKLLVAQSNERTQMVEWARISSLSLDLLQLISRLDPGASRNRGQILKDLIKPWMKIAQHDYDIGQMDEKDFQQRKIVAQGFAKDLIACYKYENMALWILNRHLGGGWRWMVERIHDPL